MTRYPIGPAALAVALAFAPLAVAAAATADRALAPVDAVADPARPQADRALDAERKPAEMLKFAGVKPGMTVVDMLPGGGYFTRLFADAVGPKGKVYAYAPDEMLKGPPAIERLNGLSAIGANVQPVHNPLLAPSAPDLIDLAWTSQNYHDLHNLPGVDVVAFNRLVFASLKPGGTFVVLDHAAKAGSGTANTGDLHRIDPAVVKQEVTAAGFVYAGESRVLANPADDHTLNVFDKSLRHRTDQFIYKFRKPK